MPTDFLPYGSIALTLTVTIAFLSQCFGERAATDEKQKVESTTQESDSSEEGKRIVHTLKREVLIYFLHFLDPQRQGIKNLIEVPSENYFMAPGFSWLVVV